MLIYDSVLTSHYDQPCSYSYDTNCLLPQKRDAPTNALILVRVAAPLSKAII